VVGEGVFADSPAVVSRLNESLLFILQAQVPPHFRNSEVRLAALEESNNTSSVWAGHARSGEAGVGSVGQMVGGVNI